jgi:hypothetical protein
VLSSIFSSNRSLAFPLRVASAACVVLVCYNAIIAVVRPHLAISYDSGTRNRAVVENYIDDFNGPAVLVGSSVAALLSKTFMGADALGPDIYNLAFAGGHAANGLQTILRKPQRPRLVLVEMNVMDRGYDLDFSGSQLAQPWRTIRAIAPGFRLENRPFDLVIVALWQAVRDGLRRFGIASREPPYSPPPSASSEPPSIDAAYRTQVGASIDVVKAQISALQTQGVRIVLVHFPAHESVERDAHTQYAWGKVHEAFPSAQYEWLELDSSGPFETTDGIHLSTASARRAASVLRQFEQARR